MGKLPKSMQQKKRRSKSLRSQGGATMNQRAPSSKGLNRQQRRRMQQQGMEGMEQIEAKRVIIQTDNGDDLVIEEPQVIKVVQEGMEVYQVIGSAKEVSSGNYASDLIPKVNATESNVMDAEMVDDSNIISNEIEEEPLSVEITDEDIKLVAMQTGVSEKIAKKALRSANGDLAKAIIDLKTR